MSIAFAEVQEAIQHLQASFDAGRISEQMFLEKKAGFGYQLLSDDLKASFKAKPGQIEADAIQRAELQEVLKIQAAASLDEFASQVVQAVGADLELAAA